MAKDLESLTESRKKRAEFKAKFGLIPESIMKHDHADKGLDIVVGNKGRAYGDTGTLIKKDRFKDYDSRLAADSFSISGRSVRAGALSRFFQNIGRFFVEFYCPEGGTVYDPFAGHNSRMGLTHSCNRHYIGVDVSSNFMEANREIRKAILSASQSGFLSNDCSIKLYERSSADVPEVPNGTADYTITSPPYWDLEYYGDEPEQLGNAKTFPSFMEHLTEHIRENHRILKPGSYCSWFINDFVKDKVFYCYHAALIKAFTDVGFVLHDITVIDLGYSLGTAFLQTILKTKRFAKKHEYACTFKKMEAHGGKE